jgi:ATP-dependent Clp protease ATP-binding subunit ClpB
LTEEHLRQIIEIHLGLVRSRLSDRHLDLKLTDAAKDHLIRVGYDPTYGARPIKRAIQKEVETPLGRLILQGRALDGQTVRVDYDEATTALTFLAEG